MTNHIDLINNTITLDLGNYVMVAMFMVLFFGMSILFLFAFVEVRRTLDRYRLKYTFDRELEFKDTDENKNSEERNRRLDKREKYFKKRVFKD